MHFPVLTSHERTVWTQEPETARLPSADIASAGMAPVCPCRMPTLLPDSRFQTRTDLSMEPETATRPFGVTATRYIPLVCPLSTLLSWGSLFSSASSTLAVGVRHAVSSLAYCSDDRWRQSM